MITLGHALTFSPGKPLPVILRNFYEPEDGYVWSHSKWCEVVFPFGAEFDSLPKNCDLVLDLDVFKAPPQFQAQPIMIYLNGFRIGQYDVNAQKTLVVSFPSSLLRKEDNSLVIDTPSSDKPVNYGINDDRLLGIQLFSAHIQPA